VLITVQHNYDAQCTSSWREVLPRTTRTKKSVTTKAISNTKQYYLIDLIMRASSKALRERADLNFLEWVKTATLRRAPAMTLCVRQTCHVMSCHEQACDAQEFIILIVTRGGYTFSHSNENNSTRTARDREVTCNTTKRRARNCKCSEPCAIPTHRSPKTHDSVLAEMH